MDEGTSGEPSSAYLTAVCRQHKHLFTWQIRLPPDDDGHKLATTHYPVSPCPFCGGIGDVEPARVNAALTSLRSQQMATDEPEARDSVVPGPATVKALRQLVLDLAERAPDEVAAIRREVEEVESASTPEGAVALAAQKPSLWSLLRPGTNAELMDQIRLVGKAAAAVFVAVRGPGWVDQLVEQLMH